jgi:hypothetical protein
MADLVVKAHFCMDGEFFGQIERSSPAYLRLIFLQVGFNRITCREPQGRTIGIDEVILHARRW